MNHTGDQTPDGGPFIPRTTSPQQGSLMPNWENPQAKGGDIPPPQDSQGSKPKRKVEPQQTSAATCYLQHATSPPHGRPVPRKGDSATGWVTSPPHRRPDAHTGEPRKETGQKGDQTGDPMASVATAIPTGKLETHQKPCEPETGDSGWAPQSSTAP